MKKFFKNLIYFFVSFMRPQGAVILMYHSVGDNREFFTVSAKEFERQMEYLHKNNFNVTRLSDLVTLLEKNLPTPPKTVAITFDDGYEDNFVVAVPILKKYVFPATIFVSTANIRKTVKGRSGSDLRIMSEEMLKELEKGGLVSIESHSNDHIKLPSLKKEEIEEQFSVSRNTLKSILGRDSSLIAYPSGKANKDISEIAMNYFRAGFGVNKGRVMYGNNIMMLKRNSVDTAVSFTQFKGLAVFGRI